jgi:MFS family permease
MVTVEKRVISAAEASVPSTSRYYVLVLLTLIYGLNFLDRTIFNVLIEPIKREFQLSDTAMGLLAGFGFVLFYSLLGMPVARFADRTNRRNIVAVAFAFWSAMTALCGMAQSVTLRLRALASVSVNPREHRPRNRSSRITSTRTSGRAHSGFLRSARISASSSAISSAAGSINITDGAQPSW